MKTLSRIAASLGITLALSLSIVPVVASASTYDQYQYYGYPSCSIRITGYSGNQGYDRTATISWTSTNADHAYIQGIGSVGQNGAMAVTYPKIASSYTMTVSNSYTSATCTTDGSYQSYPQTGYYSQGSYNGYNYDPYQYVTLEQIPYTGFDYGTFGNAMYFTIIAGFLISLAYLTAYPRLVRSKSA